MERERLVQLLDEFAIETPSWRYSLCAAPRIP
jgi:hypothetical protein